MLPSQQDHTTDLSPTKLSQKGHKSRRRKQAKTKAIRSPHNTAEKPSVNKESSSKENHTIKDNDKDLKMLPHIEFLNPHKPTKTTANGNVMSTTYGKSSAVLKLPKLDYTSKNINPVLARKELLKNKLLTQELAVRLAEAKLSLAIPDSDDIIGGTIAPVNSKPGPVTGKPFGRVSFLAVSRRVANIMRFRHAAQPKKFSRNIERELSIEIAENLPKTPRFSSYMSPAAQYSLMKGYEDILFEKLSSKYPECTGMLKRNKTPHHSIAISDKSEHPAWKLTTSDTVRNGNPSAPEHKLLEDSTDEKHAETNSRDNEWKTTSSEDGTDNNSRSTSESKALHVILERDNSDDAHENQGSQLSSELSSSKSSLPSSIPNTNAVSEFSTHYRKDSTGKKQLRKYGANEASSAQSFPEIANMSSKEQLHRDRRIVLSYRMEKAMDILDAMKTKSEQALSPRVSFQYRPDNATLLDFNRWSEKWTHEFHPDAVK